MSRAAGGTYTLPAGNPVITGTVISSTWGNTTLTDIATALTDSLSRSGLGGMTAALQLTDGGIATPSLTFTNEPTLGLYRAAAADLRLVMLGTDRLQLTTTAFNIKASNTTLTSAASGTTLTVNHTIAATIANKLTSTQTQAAVSPILRLETTAANGFVTLSLGANVAGNPVSGTADLALFQNGATLDGTLLNRANAVLNIGTNANTMLSFSATGNLTVAAPTSGTGAALSVAAIASNGAFNITATAGNNATMQFAGNGVTPGSVNGAYISQFGDGRFFIQNRASGNLVLGTNDTSNLTIVPNGNFTILAPVSGVTLTVNGIAGTHSVRIADSAAAMFNVGYLELPINSQGTPYTAVLADSGKCLYYSAAGAATFTIPASGTVVYPVGSTLTFVNDASGATNMTIAITTDTLVLSPGGATGSRTLAQYGRATAHKVSGSRWIISGTGLT